MIDRDDRINNRDNHQNIQYNMSCTVLSSHSGGYQGLS